VKIYLCPPDIDDLQPRFAESLVKGCKQCDITSMVSKLLHGLVVTWATSVKDAAFTVQNRKETTDSRVIEALENFQSMEERSLAPVLTEKCLS